MKLSVIVIAAGLLSACSQGHSGWTGNESQKRNMVSAVKLTHDIHFTVDDGAISSEERSRLKEFVTDISPRYGDVVTIEVDDAHSAQWATAKSELRDLGLRVSNAQGSYGGLLPGDTARVVVTRYVVKPPKCPDWRKQATPDFDNTQSSNFGCATATNLGAMIADPRDLVEGSEYSGPDAERAADAVRRYQEDDIKEIVRATTLGDE